MQICIPARRLTEQQHLGANQDKVTGDLVTLSIVCIQFDNHADLHSGLDIQAKVLHVEVPDRQKQ